MQDKNMIKTGSENGEIRYFVFYSDYDSTFILVKVKCLKREYDKENESYMYRCITLQNYFDERLGKVIVDHEWQLCKTLEEARHLLVLLSMNHGKMLSYKNKDPRD